MKYLLLGVEDQYFDELMQLAMNAIHRTITGPGSGTSQSGSAQQIKEFISQEEPC